MPEYNCRLQGDVLDKTRVRVTADDKQAAATTYVRGLMQKKRQLKVPFEVNVWLDGEQVDATPIRFNRLPR